MHFFVDLDHLDGGEKANNDAEGKDHDEDAA